MRKTAIFTTNPRTDWGGSYADSRSYAQMFQRSHRVTDFGIMDAQTFSTQIGSDQVNKPLIWMTQGLGNTYALNAGEDQYRWKLYNDGINRAVIVDVDANLGTQPGKAGTTFDIYCDRGYYHEPVLLKTESRDLPSLRIIGYPTEIAPGKFKYTVKLQDGDPSVFMDVKYLQVGMTIIDGGTSVSSELNTKYAGIEFGSTNELQSHIGYAGRKFEATDRMIRLEIGAREKGQEPMTQYSIRGNGEGSTFTSAVSTGYLIAPRANGTKPDKTQVVKEGSLLTTAEAMLRERLYMDCEYGMTFGKNEVTKDPDSGYDIKMGAGWLQMSKDGNYFEHNNDLTLADFTEKLSNVHFNSVAMDDRRTYIRTGQVGMKIFSRLVELELGGLGLTLSDSYVIDRVNNNGLSNEFKFGAFQFTEFHGYNGQKLTVVYDATKDNPNWYPELDPDTGKPIESASFDIFDLGNTTAAPMGAMSKSNMAMVHEPASDEYYWVSNVYDPFTGSMKNGQMVSSNNKEVGLYMAKSYKLELFDVSRSMRISAR